MASASAGAVGRPGGPGCQGNLAIRPKPQAGPGRGLSLSPKLGPRPGGPALPVAPGMEAGPPPWVRPQDPTPGHEAPPCRLPRHVPRGSEAPTETAPRLSPGPSIRNFPSNEASCARSRRVRKTEHHWLLSLNCTSTAPARLVTCRLGPADVAWIRRSRKADMKRNADTCQLQCADGQRSDLTGPEIHLHQHRRQEGGSMEATQGLLREIRTAPESSTHTAARCTACKPPLRARGTARLDAAGSAVASHFFFFLLPNWSADSATAADPD
jgi:hypothetical protein